MSFFLKPFQRNNNRGKPNMRRASFSDVHVTASLKLSDAVIEDEEDTTNAFDYSSASGDLIQPGRTPTPTSNDPNNKPPRKPKSSKRKSSRKSKSRDSMGWSGRTHNNRRAAEEKFAHDLSELQAIESFVKQISATSNGQAVLKKHLRTSRNTIAGSGA